MEIDFFFDVGSPTTYLAYHRLRQLRDEYQMTIHYEPMLLGGIFKAAGSASPVGVPAKGRYMLEQDLPRFAKRYGVALNSNPFFPLNTLPLMRGVYAARALGCEDRYLSAVFDAMWVHAKNLADADEVARVLDEAGLDAAELLRRCTDPEIKQALIDNTAVAVTRGVFGAPTLFLGDEMFFGQDRLDFVEERLVEEGLRS